MSVSNQLKHAGNILFINHLLAMGDAIFLSAVFKVIKDNTPQVNITVLTRGYAVEFLKSVRSVNKVINLDDFGIARNSSRFKKLLALVRISFLMRRFDFIIMRNDPRIPFTRFFSIAAKLIGCKGIVLMDNYLSMYVSADSHILTVYQKILQDLGYEVPEKMKFDISVSEQGKTFAEKYLVENEIKNERIIGVFPASTIRIKSLLPGVLIDILNVDLFAKFRILLFSMDDKLNDGVCKAISKKPIVIGKLHFDELVGLISKCNFVIAADTGPLHIAVALGIPSIGIYGPTSGMVTGPYGDIGVAIQSQKDCRFYDPIAPYSPSRALQVCYIKDECQLNMRSCIDNISAKDILDVINDKFKHILVKDEYE